MYKTRFDYSKINHLLNCDTVLKYKFTNKYKIPAPKNLTVQVSLKSILLASEFLNKDDFNKNIQLKAILIVYILSSTMPYICFYNYKNSRFLKDKTSGDFIIKLNISNKDTIINVLKELYLNNFEIFSNEQITNYNKYLSYNIKTSSNLFQNINNYFIKTNSTLNIEKIDIQLSLIYKTTNLEKNNILNILKNNSCFG